MVIRSDFGWDLSVKNRNGRLILVVEIKRKTNVSSEWATQLRQNILAHRSFPKAPYFLMVFPDKLYLWSNAAHEQSEPAYTIDASSILQPYVDRIGVAANQMSEASLELIVASWLGEIIYSDQWSENIDPSQQWLIESGLYAALVGGKLEHEAAA